MFNLFNLLLKKSVFCDAPEPWQLGFQDPATPMVEGMIFFLPKKFFLDLIQYELHLYYFYV
jgi:hypothetical protein